MSANIRKPSSSRLKFSTGKPVRVTAKMGNHASFYEVNAKENKGFDSKIPRLLQSRGSFNEKSSESKIPMLQRSSTFNNSSTPKKAPEYKDEPEIKARPFKRMVGFFVKKSDRKLTVPIQPKLSKPNRKQRVEDDKQNDRAVDIDSLKIPVSLPNKIEENSKFNGSEWRSSQKCSISENASTNCSKSRVNSRSKAPITYKIPTKPSINVK